MKENFVGSVNWLKSKRQKWTLVIFFTVFVPFFLIVFQPFGVNNYDPSHKLRGEFLLAVALFGIVNGLTLLFYEFVIAPVFFKSDSKVVFALRILLEILLVGAITFLVYNVLGNFHDWSWTSFVGFLRDIFFLSIFPLALLFLYFNYQHTKNINNELQFKSVTGKPANTLITLKPTSGSEILALSLSKIRYLEAEENYVSVFHMENDTLKRSLLRSTMKHLEAQLAPYSIIRCHRSYYVNSAAVVKVYGHAHKLQLYLKSVDHSIPVSRSYIAQVRKQLAIQPK